MKALPAIEVYVKFSETLTKTRRYVDSGKCSLFSRQQIQGISLQRNQAWTKGTIRRAIVV